MSLDGGGGHALDQERVVLGPISDERENRSVALVARAAVGQVVELRHGLLSKRVTWGTARSRGIKQETIPTCSVTDLRAPPPPAGPFVYSASTSSPTRNAASFSVQRAATRRRTSYGFSSATNDRPWSEVLPMRSTRNSPTSPRRRSRTMSAASR